MKLSGNKAKLMSGLLFLFILISLLYTDENLPDENLDDELSFELQFDYESYFFEEFFIYDDLFSFTGEEIPPEETVLDVETVPQESTLLAEEAFEDIFMEEFPFYFEAPPLIVEAPVFEMRSLDEIFPNLTRGQRTTVMSSNGLRNYFTRDENPVLVPNSDLEINLLSSVMEKNPSHLIEALVVVPYYDRELDLLDIYNALGRIESIKDHPVTVNNRDFYIFSESSRIISSSNRRDISDPPPALTLPFSETLYLRLREANFGNLFFRGDISISVYGISYSMTNFMDVRYFLIPIMRAERFTTILYLETVKEGMLIYCVSGFYILGFIADRANLNVNINRRIDVFLKWIIEGLRIQERSY